MIKKIGSYVALFVVIAGLVVVSVKFGVSRKALADSGNLIQNSALAPDPSNVAVPQYWNFASWGTNNAAGTYPVSGPDPSSTAVEVTITSYTSGLADWYPANAASVTPFAEYSFSDAYLSNTPSVIEAQYSIVGTSTYYYTDIALLPSTNGSWQNASATFAAPAGATSLTIYHLIDSIGSLSMAHPTLVQTAGPQTFPQGMVSLAFDDVWQTQYDVAGPMIADAGIPGTFYIITQPMTQDAVENNILCNNTSLPNCDGAIITASTTTWTATEQYPDPSEDTYRFSEHYTATAPVTFTVSYFHGNGKPITGEQGIVIGTFPATASFKTASATFTIPVSIMQLISPNSCGGPYFTLQETVPNSQTLRVQTARLVENNLDLYDDYMTASEVYALNAAGNEIGDHTVNHCDLATGLCPNANIKNSPDPLNAMQEIDQASSTLHGIGAVPVNTFAYPYGDYNTTIEDDVQRGGFIAARSVNRGYNLKNTDRYALQIQQVDASTTSDADFQNIVKPYIDAAVANHEWLILLFHQIEPISTIVANSDADATTPGMFQDIVQYLKQNNIPVKTVHDAVCMMDGMSSNPACTHPVVYPPAPALSGYYDNTTSTGNDIGTVSAYNEGTGVRVVTVTVTGLSESDTASVNVQDTTNETFVSRSMKNGTALFALFKGDSYSVSAISSNTAEVASTSAGCSGALTTDTACTATFSH